ncbi:hypothetical protein HDU76_005075 [Blyttiomyces sp. JEL0837]|nr:hypothetical protein HDU76_005075 [Blyttiomyces sp. JEL0837]
MLTTSPTRLLKLVDAGKVYLEEWMISVLKKFFVWICEMRRSLRKNRKHPSNFLRAYDIVVNDDEDDDEEGLEFLVGVIKKWVDEVEETLEDLDGEEVVEDDFDDMDDETEEYVDQDVMLVEYYG